MKVLQFPLMKIALCFVCGILVAHYTKPNFLVVITLLFSCLFFLSASYLISRKRLLPNPYFGAFSFLTAFSIGLFTLISNNQTYHSKHYLHQIKSNAKVGLFEIEIIDKLKNTTNNDRYTAKVYQLNNKKSYGKLILNIKKSSVLPTIINGSQLRVREQLYQNRKPNNPNQFDYGNYLENQQIYAQIYARASDVQINSKPKKTLGFYASKFRKKIIYNLEKNNFNKTELSVVVALILGQQQDISQEIIRDYQYAGAVHVLSVSGLHVGFILLFVTFLLKPIPNSKKGAFFKLIIVLLSLWTFGIIAGLAPSVLRSVTMFSFVAIGMFLRRSVNIYHTLMVSAMLILLFEPSFLFDIGFQLSYVALFFIVWLQPLLASCWSPKNKIINYFWDIITVSFAAQIGTFPLSIYYFHQFPGLFFITNLVILPGLSVILGLGVIVMILTAFDVIFIPLLKIVEYSIFILNKIINWVASFEEFILKDISINWYMMSMCYLLIFSTIIWIKKPKFSKLIITFIALLLFQTVSLYAVYSNQNKSEFIVFNKKKCTLITERYGTKVHLYSTDSILKTTDDNLVLKSYLIANFCKLDQKKQLTNYHFFKGKKIRIMDSSAVFLSIEKPDILIFSHSPKINLERLFLIHKPKQVVVDASNYKTYVKVWKATCLKEKIPFHDTAEKGFFKL